MRRHFLLCVSFIIMVIFVFPAASAAADELPAAYFSDFSSGPDGWYGRGSAVVSATKGKTLLTKSRTQDWNSPGRDFDLIKGMSYEISAEVFQKTAESMRFMISVAHTVKGKETYENIGWVTAKKGKWEKDFRNIYGRGI